MFMARKIQVGDVMTRNFVSVLPNTHLLDCARKMVKQRVDSLIIAEDKKLTGIITQKDILWAIIKKPDIDLKTIFASDIATKKIAVISPSADLVQAFQKMKKLGFRRLPVVSRGGIVGLLTLKDILKIEPSYYTRAGDLIDIREEAEKRRRISNPGEENEGFCDNCGSFADLTKVKNLLLCPDCLDEFS